ncbi:hypothetical protein DIPPA_62323 [Diplonema papillatum]|nr:hypothetical protein DIPPA_62323 [Diplonema papillatum]
MHARSLGVIATLVVVCKAQFPTECVLDVGLGAYGLLDAGLAVNRAVSTCGDSEEKAKCAADIGSVLHGLGSASGYLTEAAGSCGGKTSACAADISFAVANVGNAVRFGGDAASCGSEDTFLCVSDVLRLGSSVALAIHNIERAVSSCQAAPLPSPATLCGASLVTLRRSIGDAFPPSNTTTTLLPSHVNETATACGSCFDDASLRAQTVAKDWQKALQILVQSGARCN